MKQIPKKNYVVLLTIMIFTIIVVLYMSQWYKAYKNYYNNTSPLVNIINEINTSELYNYSVENPTFILYMSSETDNNNKKFEESLKKFIIKNNLKESFIYINVDNNPVEKIKESLQSSIDTSMLDKIDENIQPNIYYIENGQITAVLYKNKMKPDIITTKNFLTEKIEIND